MLKFEVVKEENKCRELWDKFSPREVLWDLWDFRHCFHGKNFDFYFVLGLEGNNEIGLLPLVYDKESDIYTYFGDTFPENNKFFLKDKSKLPLFLGQCPKEAQIYYIDSSENEHYNFVVGEKKYFLDLRKYHSDIENYLKTFSKKHRKNIKYDLKKLKEKNYKIETNKTRDFLKLVNFNKQKFGNESDYNERGFVESIRKLLKAAKKMKMLHMLSIKLDEKTEAVGLGVVYNKIYYVIGSGRNIEIKNFGKLLIFEQIRNALEKGCDEIDFLSTEAGWKELWNLETEQMYEFTN